mmetsp:Transcript_19771/g.61406  ORF Transcript_19771/g.61406 Transcript_19771/m.61406 type:complete len:508 (-) Transcript_19771:19-1542(-)
MPWFQSKAVVVTKRPPFHARFARRCRGLTQSGTRCRWTSASEEGPAKPLRQGEDYCVYHKSQNDNPSVIHCRGLTQHEKACHITSVTDVAEAAPLREQNGSEYCGFHQGQLDVFRDEPASNEPGDHGGAREGEAAFRGPEAPHFSGQPYGLASAVWPQHPTVPAEYALPSWALRPTLQDTLIRSCVRSFAAFIVHHESMAVVGRIDGQLVRRVSALPEHSKTHSTELHDTVTTLFDETHRFALRSYLKRGSMWADGLDAGNVLVISRLYVARDHASRAFEHLAPALRMVCRGWGAPNAVVGLSLLRRAHSTADDTIDASTAAWSTHQLRESFASMGFRRIGITDWMAMVTDQRHPCWDPATHKPPEFPFREVAKTVRSAAFRTVVGKCVVAECTAKNDEAARYKKQFGSEGERWDEAKVLAEANAAVDALVNHDPKTLFGNCNKEEYGMPAQLLYETLVKQMPVWRSPHNASKSLKRDIEELLRELLAMGNPLHPPRHYGMPPFDTS